ncbi:uncharacterized protein LOC111307253 [Durio zibethinus]|uniref:Uncharacterized protein LOC111307253 n=1 Tax=Durio zibethinus TaxID=66656 RepID=A0A6P6A858_DURZI|nr:uncharacterized protein LOC111307253 [Durio zibethinus]
MESQTFGHEHSLVLLNEEQISNASEKAKCSMCGEKVSAPSFGCFGCRFYLHKKCAEAPLEINHPFHRDHPLALLQSPPSSYTWCVCYFCNKTCKRFVYHCSCKLDFHIKCALFTYNIAEKNLRELEHVALEDPPISTESDIGEELKDVSKCFGCWEPLINYTHFSLDCGFNLHKKCVDLPLKINHPSHRKHPLLLQFNSERLSCKICQETPRRGFVYCCSPCKFAVHIGCVSQPPVVEDKSHQHPFTLLLREAPFICDACGTEGNCVAYICCTCNIIVHKKCLSLPRIIRSKWHEHRISHTYFFHEEDFKSQNCLICHEEVNTEYGSYSCLSCNIIFHVNCVTKDKDSYFIVSLKNEGEKSSESLELLPDISIESITCVFERNDAGEATKIKHFKHIHNLMLSDKIRECDKSCDGCVLPISDSFYYCSQCDFFLHKACAELPKMKHVWHHDCQQPLILTSDDVFRCENCRFVSNAFAYKCGECERRTCLRCVIALTPGARTSPKHEHPLLYYNQYEGHCIACGDGTDGAFCCKECNFALDPECFSLPTAARHKCDEHLLILTNHDGNNYSECYYCDICEERRDPNHWFYHCATCDNSAHIDCVLGNFPFIKLGGIYKYKGHPHPLTFVNKIYYYPDCVRCGKPCQGLALECAKSGCNYIVHWKCIAPINLWWSNRFWI